MCAVYILKPADFFFLCKGQKKSPREQKQLFSKCRKNAIINVEISGQ